MPTVEEVKTHDNEEDCWIIIHGKAYNVTDFLDEHPGGKDIILKYAGRDATKAFDVVHPRDMVDHLAEENHLGDVEGDMEAVAPDDADEEDEQTEEEIKRQELISLKPDLSKILNLFDFELVARQIMTNNGWAYYSSGADDEITLRENHLAYQQIFFRPRILINVSNVDLSTTMLGCPSKLPFYVTATALGKLGHADGEKILTRACGTSGIIQMIPTLASFSFDEIADEAIDGQNQWFQLYVNSDRKVTERIVRHAEERGIKGLFITVDAPALGRREKDMRSKFSSDQDSNVQKINEKESKQIDRNQGAARAISSFIDTSLNWEDIKWFQSITKMPIILKGVQRWEDAVRAAEIGCSGIVISNHGGRQLEFAPAPVEVLAEIEKFLIFVDGGIRRATDIMKALSLGCNGVGIGRPFLYAMSTYGQEGVEKAFDILRDELEMNMRLIGATKIDDLNESFVNIKGTGKRTIPNDYLFNSVYEPLGSSNFKPKL
ncbi:hypothetical protein PACTADRAFT_50736 [Pachysolen tannophilus NRRL Y-2460]|uniref:L-lactate dehydrogenase (cytochrome) n=1 Tax=Pachysolen tannophilus NRRL Y-2460 TaxID=669874 RepID=A0A1E4TT39_PACTA|nr:hypothetical protein PACTADRAFT_50736 [Pachysolen tannophilus NRRL Y-2460]